MQMAGCGAGNMAPRVKVLAAAGHLPSTPRTHMKGETQLQKLPFDLHVHTGGAWACLQPLFLSYMSAYKCLGAVLCACNSRAEGAGTGGSWGLLASQKSQLVSDRFEERTYLTKPYGGE